MTARIEDYALIGNMRTAALVGKNGSIDWLCAPDFDSRAAFAALLGDDSNGAWRIAPRGETQRVTRRYRGDTLVLETEFETEDGTVRVVDCMPPGNGTTNIARVVEGASGRVEMEMFLSPRFDYGHLVPSIGQRNGGAFALAGPDALALHTPVELQEGGGNFTASFTVAEGESVPFSLSWHPSYEPAPSAIDPVASVANTEAWWQEWSNQCAYNGPFRTEALRSLITLKALTFAPTGGIVAAPTTSLPEEIGGERNWDYRFCWLRDGAFTIAPLVRSGYRDEAIAWRDWLLRAIAGDPNQLQLMYGIRGEHRLEELELPWLRGFGGSAPVRIGNAASNQFQLDVYGEVMAAVYAAWRAGIMSPAQASRPSGLPLGSGIELIARQWKEPDEGIWEIRGERKHFVYSKVSAWSAVDRAIEIMEAGNRTDVPLDQWRALRDEIHADVMANGFNEEKNSFVQYYGGTGLDASLLLIPFSGFLPPDDPRIVGTVRAVQREISSGPFVWRYATEDGVDGLAGSEGAFLICAFWLAAALALIGETEEAKANLRQLAALRNDVGLLAEEYDPDTGQLLGNFPQAFSHIGLLHALYTIVEAESRSS